MLQSSYIKSLLLFAFFIGNFVVTAQYTEIINSNRPGFSQSPYSVGTGVYQFESNIFFRETPIVPTFTKPESLGINLDFRTSIFLEKLELNANITSTKDQVASKNIFTSYYFTFGAKYLVYKQEYTDKTKEIRSWKKRHTFDWKRLIPSVAVYAGLNTDFADKQAAGKISAKVGLLMQNEITHNFILVSNVYYDKISTDYSNISYIVTATMNFNNRWSGFLENQQVFYKNKIDGNIGVGAAYLFTKNLQVNASTRMLFENETTGFYGGIGVSYRINRHVDSYRELEEPVE